MPTPEAWTQNLENLHRIANGIPDDVSTVADPDESEELGEVEPEDRFEELDVILTRISEEVISLLDVAPPEIKVPFLKFIFGLFIVQAFEKADDE